MAEITAGTSEIKSKTQWCPNWKTAPTWAAQCTHCNKWRVIPTQREYEEIRESIWEVPFSYRRKEGASCNDPPDVELGNGSSWSFDKPNLPKSPPGFTRKLSLRNDLSRLEVYYETPTGKVLRRPHQVVPFLSEHSEYHHVSPTDFDFQPPRIAKRQRCS